MRPLCSPLRPWRSDSVVKMLTCFIPFYLISLVCVLLAGGAALLLMTYHVAEPRTLRFFSLQTSNLCHLIIYVTLRPLEECLIITV